MAKICLCMTAKTLERDLEILEKYRKYADLVELRADCLEPDERLLIRRFPELAGLPVILTIRRDLDGGRFVGGEGARVSLMARGLAYAEADRRRNFAFLDIEDDLDVPSLEEAAQTFGTRIIRSYHNTKGTDTNLANKIRTMRHSEDEIVKISVTANSTKDVLSLLRAGKECPEQEKILISMGHYGAYSRILAEQFGSYLSYSTAFLEEDAPVAAPGQIEIQELESMYRFRKITKDTKIYGVVGNPLKATGSPLFFNSVFELEGTDAVYVPFPANSITDFMDIANELNVEGVSVTVPFKEAVIPFLDTLSDDVRNIGACNTLCLTPQGWLGTNTDARGFSDSLLAFLRIPSFKRKRVTVIGAGGAARAVVFELHRLGAKVLILNRTALKARRLAAPYKFAWGGLDDRQIEMIDKYHDIIIQTTSVGMEGTETEEFAGLGNPMDTKDPTGFSGPTGLKDETNLKDLTGLKDPLGQRDPAGQRDPLAMYSFSGKEGVMDLIYKPKTTPFLRRASHAGCNILNGYDMLIRQAQYQYVQFTGKEFPEHFTSKVQFGET